MPSPLEVAGSRAPKEARFAPLYTNRFFTGLWTNRSPLRDAATPFLYEKFYSASRFESIINGSDMEIGPRLTPVRRAGHSVYNNQNFQSPNRFYPFRISNQQQEVIQVIIDTAATVYNGTGPSTKVALFNKAAGNGQTKFQAIGNRLFFGDGISVPSKYVQTLLAWQATTAFSLGQYIVDANLNIQQVTVAGTSGGSLPVFSGAVRGTVTDGGITWTNRGNAVQGWGEAAPPAPTVTPITTPNIFVCRFWGPSTTYGSSASNTYVIFDGLNLQILVDGTKTTGTSFPIWNSSIFGSTPDGTASWINLGPLVPVTATYKLSAAVNYQKYSCIVDFNGNLQVATTGGNTAGGANYPAWSTTPGTTTTDGGVTWTCAGSAAFISGGYSWGLAYHTFDGHYTTLSVQSPTVVVMGQGPFGAIISGQGIADGQVDQVWVFRTLSGQPLPFFALQVPNTGAGALAAITDAVLDPNLNQFVQAALAGTNNPPPAGFTNIVEHAGRIFGSVGSVIWFTAPASATTPDPYQSVPPTNFFTVQSNVIRMVSTAIGLLVFTTTKVYIITGQGITGVSPFNQPRTYLSNVTLLNYDALTTNGSLLYLLDGRKRQISFDPSSGISHTGLPIADQFKALYNPSTAYATWHCQDGLDDALYMGDGSTGWFRLNPTPAPEAGMTWSPKANIVGGCKCVQTVETSPGVHQLLVGASGNGPILFRDPTVFQDNGAPYANCFADIGSIVLAQHGHVAELDFIAQDMPRVGSRPTISVRLNEVGGNFFPLPSHVKSPTYLPESKTLYSDRWYFSAVKKPAYCNHLQIRFAFPNTDTVQNEIYAYSIYGAILKEK